MSARHAEEGYRQESSSDNRVAAAVVVPALIAAGTFRTRRAKQTSQSAPAASVTTATMVTNSVTTPIQHPFAQAQVFPASISTVAVPTPDQSNVTERPTKRKSERPFLVKQITDDRLAPSFAAMFEEVTVRAKVAVRRRPITWRSTYTFGEFKQGKTMHFIRWALAILLLTGLTGCQSSLMVRSGPGSAEPTPAPGKALVVFMRPSSFGGAIQSSVYDTHASADTFIGIVSSKDKIAYQTVADSANVSCRRTAINISV